MTLGSRLAAIGCVAAVGLGVGAAVWLGSTSSATSALAAAAGGHRLTVARLTGGFAYEPTLTGFAALPPASQIAIANTATSGTAPERGAALLLLGNVDSARNALLVAAGDRWSDARVLNDLAAAYLERHRKHGDFRDAIRGLETVERSLQAKPDLPEALYNRALALDAVTLGVDASRAWRGFVAADDGVGWATEARRRIERQAAQASSAGWAEAQAAIRAGLAREGDVGWQPMVDRYRAAAREWLEDDVLAEWAAAAAAKDPAEATSALAAAERLAVRLAEQEGDPLCREAVEAIRRASGSRASSLAAGHLAYQRARRAYMAQKFDDARSGFEAALVPLREAGSPLALWAEFHLAVIAYQKGARDVADAALRPLGDLAASRSYQALAGRASWVRGLIAVGGGSFQPALALYRTAIERFARTGEREHSAFVENLLGEAYRALGEERSAWTHVEQALANRSLVRRPSGRQSILLNAAVMCQRFEAPLAALRFQQAAHELAQAGGTVVQRADGLLRLADAVRRGGDVVQARREVLRAVAAVERIPPGALRDRMEAELAVVQAALGDAPVDRLSSAIALFRNQQMPSRIPALLLERARAHRASGDVEAAAADLEAGIQAVDAELNALSKRANRTDYLDSRWDLHVDYVRLEAEARKRPDVALARLEAARSVVGSAQRFAAVGGRLDQLSPGVAVVVFLVTDDRLLMWSVTHRGTTFQTRNVSRQRLEALVLRHTGLFSDMGASADGAAAGAELYELLIGSLPEEVRRVPTLALVPDGVLHRVAFAALVNPISKKYLVEEHTLVEAASVAQYRRASSNAGLPSGSTGALIVDASKPTPSALDPNMPPLQWAAGETGELARLYRGATVLDGGSATRDRFLTEVGRHRVVHFAGHAVANGDRPELSRLLFAGPPSSPDATVLFLGDLEGQTWSGTRVVVLGACSTAGGRVSRSQGTLSLAAPFLASGVSSVVASLVDVSDREASRLLTIFHRQYRRLGNTPAALRAAQLEMLASPDATERSVAAWATFVAVGS